MKTVILFIALCSLLFFSACSKEETQTEVTPPQPEKVEKSAVAPSKEAPVAAPTESATPQEMKVLPEEGILKEGEGRVPTDLGVPVYPGAVKKENAGIKLSGKAAENLKGISVTMLFSNDSIDKVMNFYKEKLQEKKPEISEVTKNMRMVNIFLENEDPTIHIALTENKDTGGTNIQIAKIPQ